MNQSLNQSPFFSIVIPTYNRASLIFETLESVFQQTYTNYEIIVVDNASTDNTIELLSPLDAAGKIRLIRNEKNIERSKARNVGFKNAKGDFLTLLDSDDFMYPSNLQDAADFILENPSIHFFHNFYELVDSHKKALYHYSYPHPSKQLKALAEGNFVSCIGVFLSKKVYSNYHFNEDEKILGSEDWELWIRVRSKYNLGVIPKINNGIRHHTQRSITAYDLDSIVARKEYIIENLLKDKNVKASFNQYKELMLASAYVFGAISANQALQFKQAKNLLKKALKIYPKLLLKPRFLRAAQIANLKLDKSIK
tara:strand:+ start:679 stop:1608 length:930 start_codon:yes stop_codon:yes gene_type:complete